MNVINQNRYANNFDFIRILAASFVMIGHSSEVLQNVSLPYDPGKILFGFSMQSLGVLIFFIISGFLVTGSFEKRHSWIQFMAGRILRIFPALIVVVLLSVFALGLLITSYPVTEYLSDIRTSNYIQNMTLYRMYYYLPGVFDGNPIGGSVNASLWTLPYEFTCYLYIAFAGFSVYISNRWNSLVLFIVYFISYIFFQEQIDRIVIPILGIDFKTFFIPFLYFLSGSLFYKFRNNISYNWMGVFVCCIAVLLNRIELLHHQFLIPVIAYLVFAFAFSKSIKLNYAAKYGDFSYGLYLYAFPVQQLIVYFLPVMQDLWLMMLLSFLCTMPCAIASWHLIEKPALSLKTRFRF